MAQNRYPNMFIALVLFVGGLVLAYYILRINGLHSGAAIPQIWSGLPVKMRIFALGGFVVSAYGLGAAINNITGRA
jgi:hypothetical protein